MHKVCIPSHCVRLSSVQGRGLFEPPLDDTPLDYLVGLPRAFQAYQFKCLSMYKSPALTGQYRRTTLYVSVKLYNHKLIHLFKISPQRQGIHERLTEGYFLCWCLKPPKPQSTINCIWNVSYKLMENFGLLIVYYNQSIYIVDLIDILFNQTTPSNSLLYSLQREYVVYFYIMLFSILEPQRKLLLIFISEILGFLCRLFHFLYRSWYQKSACIHWYQRESWRQCLGEVEGNSCIALSGKGGHSWLRPSRLCPDLTSGELWGVF